MNLFSVELKNQPGELAHVGNICAQHGVNLQLAGVTTGDHGTVLFTASDEPRSAPPWRALASSSPSGRRFGSRSRTSPVRRPSLVASSPTPG
jgi:hypothetical protein